MMRKYWKKKIILITILSLGLPLSSFGVDGQIKLSQPVPPAIFPITINQHGSYVLTSNLTVTDPDANAINIEVNDVTIDLNGHVIQGPQSGSSIGIYANNRFSVNIKNGRIWGFGGYGIRLQDDSSPPLYYGASHRLENLQILNNGAGVSLTSCIVINCSACNNEGFGFHVLNSTLSNCLANNNKDPITNTGIGFLAHYSAFSNCTANNNEFGFSAHNSVIENCTACNNVKSGFLIGPSTIRGCVASYNGTHGIQAEYDCAVTDCTVFQNNLNGIYSSFRSVINGCNATYNKNYGIYLTNADGGIYVYRNTSSGNFSGQIFCPTGNMCVDNFSFP